MRKLSLIISQVHYKVVTTETKDYRGPQIVHGTNRIILYSEHQCTLQTFVLLWQYRSQWALQSISPTTSRLKSVRLFACNESGITDQLSASVLYYSCTTLRPPLGFHTIIWPKSSISSYHVFGSLLTDHPLLASLLNMSVYKRSKMILDNVKMQGRSISQYRNMSAVISEKYTNTVFLRILLTPVSL